MNIDTKPVLEKIEDAFEPEGSDQETGDLKVYDVHRTQYIIHPQDDLYKDKQIGQSGGFKSYKSPERKLVNNGLVNFGEGPLSIHISDKESKYSKYLNSISNKNERLKDKNNRL